MGLCDGGWGYMWVQIFHCPKSGHNNFIVICITTKIEVQLVTMVMLCTKQSLVAVGWSLMFMYIMTILVGRGINLGGGGGVEVSIWGAGGGWLWYFVTSPRLLPRLLDVLGSDPQLAAEIAFDLKKFEEEQRRATIQTPIPKTPLAQLVRLGLHNGVCMQHTIG